jgi:hypothetical protein
MLVQGAFNSFDIDGQKSEVTAARFCEEGKVRIDGIRGVRTVRTLTGLETGTWKAIVVSSQSGTRPQQSMSTTQKVAGMKTI